MKRLFIITTCVLTAAALTAGCAKSDLIAKKNRQIDDLGADVDRLQREVDRLENEIDTQEKINADLENSLADMRTENEALLQKRQGLTHITIDGSAGFATASAELTPEARKTLDRIGEVLKRYPDRWILVEGHADARPIADALTWKYASNWELSTARASSVLHYMIDNRYVDAERVKVVGLGSQHPVEEGALSKNRRVVITVGSKVDIKKRTAMRKR